MFPEPSANLPSSEYLVPCASRHIPSPSVTSCAHGRGLRCVRSGAGAWRWSEVGEKRGKNTPTFAGWMPQSAMHWRCLQKVGVKIAINTPTYGWCPRMDEGDSGEAFVLSPSPPPCALQHLPSVYTTTSCALSLLPSVPCARSQYRAWKGLSCAREWRRTFAVRTKGPGAHRISFVRTAMFHAAILFHGLSGWQTGGSDACCQPRQIIPWGVQRL